MNYHLFPSGPILDPIPALLARPLAIVQNVNYIDHMSNSETGDLDPTDVEIGNRITSAMLIKGITRDKLSEQTGISYSTLRRSLNGARSFSFFEFGRIAKALGVSKHALITDEIAGRAVAA